MNPGIIEDDLKCEFLELFGRLHANIVDEITIDLLFKVFHKLSEGVMGDIGTYYHKQINEVAYPSGFELSPETEMTLRLLQDKADIFKIREKGGKCEYLSNGIRFYLKHCTTASKWAVDSSFVNVTNLFSAFDNWKINAKVYKIVTSQSKDAILKMYSHALEKCLCIADVRKLEIIILNTKIHPLKIRRLFSGKGAVGYTNSYAKLLNMLKSKKERIVAC